MENPTPAPLPTGASAKEGPVSKVPTTTPLPAEALAKEGPVIPESPNTVIPGMTRNPESNKKFSLKLFIGIIAFLLLAGGAAASFVYKDNIVSLIARPTPAPTVILSQSKDPSPTPISTANWKTYTGDVFSFKYPNTVKIGKDKEGVIQLVYVEPLLPGAPDGYELPPGYKMDFKHGALNSKSLREIVNESILEQIKYQINITSTTDITIGDYHGHAFTGVLQSGFKKIFLSSGYDLFAEITYEINDKSNNGYDEEVNYILSTFKFTQNQNEDLSIKLPSDWQILKNSVNEIKIAQNNGMNSLTLTKYQNQNMDEMIQLAKKGIVRNLNSTKHVIDGVEATEYSGCLNPEVCNRVTNIVLPVKDAYYILHAPDIDPILLDQILSGIQIRQKANN